MSVKRRSALRAGWLTLLVGSTAMLAWLWITSYSNNPKQFFRSTDRFCSWIGLKDGRFMYHYDGGADAGLIAPRDIRFLGVFVMGGRGGLGGWQEFEAGIHAAHACIALALAWMLTAWLQVGRPWVRQRKGRCRRCGYSLRGLVSATCPECGTSADARGSHPVARA